MNCDLGITIPAIVQSAYPRFIPQMLSLALE